MADDQEQQHHHYPGLCILRPLGWGEKTVYVVRIYETTKTSLPSFPELYVRATTAAEKKGTTR